MYHRRLCSALIEYSYGEMNSIYEAISPAERCLCLINMSRLKAESPQMAGARHARQAYVFRVKRMRLIQLENNY